MYLCGMIPDTIYKVSIEDCRRIVTPVRLLNIANGREEVVKGLWDTGSEVSAITRGLSARLDLPSNRSLTVNGFGGRSEVRAVMAMTFPGDCEFAVVVQAIETEGISDGIDFIIGMDIIEKGRFSLDWEYNSFVLTFQFGEKFMRLKSEWITRI